MKRQGFTLVELAIVLVIIGLIMGAILKGQDLIRSAKEKNFYRHFIWKWKEDVLMYYDKTGYLLGDGQQNGGTASSPDGLFDNIYLSKTNTNGAKVIARLKAVGIIPPSTNVDDPGRFVIKGKYARSIVRAYLYHFYDRNNRVYYNAIYFIGIPTDVAIAVDKIIDGEANGTSGLFKRYVGGSELFGSWPDDASTTRTVNAAFIVELP
jgi:prepilin-type N-terminal cleavage/methylation domain-containing protein